MKKLPITSMLLMAFGSFLFALTVNLFLFANHMGEGGVTGITILLFYTLGIPPEWSNIAINTFLLIIGFKYLDRSRIFYTVYTYVLFSVFLKLTAGFSYTFHDPILVPIVGGMLIGSSIGIILLAGGSTAGTDIIALMMNRYLHIPTTVSLFLIDLFIIIPGGFVIGFEKMVYTLLMLGVSITVIDFILSGLNPKKAITIISEHHEEIANKIATDVERGITVLHGHGYFSKADKQILYVVVPRKEVITITKIVNHIDAKAFFTISSVNSVTGEGFTYHLNEEIAKETGE